MVSKESEKAVFIVGSMQEVGYAERAGYKAVSVGDYDAGQLASLALNLAHKDITAIVLLDGEERQRFTEACYEAGTPVRIASKMRAGASVDIAQPMGGDPGYEAYAGIMAAEMAEAVRDRERLQSEAREERLRRAHVHDAMDVAMDLYAGTCSREYMPTGLKGLDGALGGGLPEGTLTVLAAGSSNGKTTLAVQIADHLASSGIPVMFATIEQGRHELVSKSLSRMMRLTKKHNGGYYTASAAHIMSMKERDRWPKDKTEALLACCTAYTQTIAPNMHYFETEGQPTIAEIKRAYEAVADYAGASHSPVLVLDYLQILKPADPRMTERQAVDRNVMELRQLARDRGTAVIAISSINRASYNEGAGLGAFKESGAIEFGADVALMLQPRGFSEAVGKVRSEKEAREVGRSAMAEHKGKSIRQSEIVMLKHRGGAMPSEPIPLMFDALSNLFTDDEPTARPGTKKVL